MIFNNIFTILQHDQLLVGLIAQISIALFRYRRGHGFKSGSGVNFFLGCLSFVYNCDDPLSL